MCDRFVGVEPHTILSCLSYSAHDLVFLNALLYMYAYKGSTLIIQCSETGASLSGYCRTTWMSTVQSFVLIVIDTNGGPFHDLSRAIAEYRKNSPPGSNRVVWLDNPGSGNIQSQGLDEDKLPAADIIITKPFHGSRLYQVLGLLPEFGGTMPEATPANSTASEAARTSTPHALPFDYILMDCEMPVMNGTEATRRIREEEARYGVHIPIFAVSAHTDGPELSQMREAGVDFSVSKPLNPSKLEEAVRTFEDNTERN